jgi:pilus assembly protein TadC
MTSQPLAVLALAAALLSASGSPGCGRLRTLLLGHLGATAEGRPRRATRPSSGDDPVELAAVWAELAVCLEAGMPVAAAVAATAEPLDGSTGTALRRVAGLLELGSDPAQAWRTAHADPAAGTFARAAARSAATGAALARTARAESARVRESQTDVAEARANRAGVLIAAPLGLCFLPAFLVLGVVPVVIGLAGEVLAPW